MDSPSAPCQSPLKEELPRVLGLFAAAAIVVGEVIGSGIFFKPSQVASSTGGYLGVILLLWVVCGLVNLCGALTLAELSTIFPHSGGTYVFLREAYGRMWAFLWCWAEFWVIRTAAIAALAAYSALALRQALGMLGSDTNNYPWWLSLEAMAVSFIVILGAINLAGTYWGGSTQVILTAIKIGSVAILAGIPWWTLSYTQRATNILWPAAWEPSLLPGIGTALAAIMWAYDGWGNVTVVAAEIHHPQRNIPRALIAGVLMLVVLYVGVNLAYHITLPAQEIARAPIPAVAVCKRLFPNIGAPLMFTILMISQFGALNGNILVGPRVLYAVAGDFWFLAPLRRIHPTRRTPALAIILVCTWASLLILLGALVRSTTPIYDLLTNYCIFGGSIFYLTAILAVFVLRIRQPDLPRPYRTWGYPITPAIFAIFYVFLLGTMLWSQPRECLLGLALILAGLVVYLVMPRDQPQRNVDSAQLS